MIASRNISKSMPRFSSNDMVHNHYLNEARKKTQERDRNLQSSMMPSARFQSTIDGSNQNLGALITQLGVCLYLRVCIFNANHDACMTAFLKEVNSHATIQSNKTRNSNKPIEQKSHTQKPSRQIFKGHRFSPNKTSAVYEKTSPISDLRWKPTGRNFKVVGLRWVPTGKIPSFCTSKDDSEPIHGSNVDIHTIHECKQTLDLSEGTSINVQNEQSFDLSADLIVMTSMIEFGSIFSPLFDEYFNGENQVVSKSSVVTTTDASDKHQQQPDSTSSTSTLATSVTADGNFNL
ncbi:hypothetical protein Tco_1175038 [Tanacetum coccineum]